MTERYITLLGAEQVERAAATMRNTADYMQRAADQMQSAASSFADTLEQHQRFMDGWLARLEAALAKSADPSWGDR